MKKILLIFIILTLTGCNKTINIEEEITEIKYNTLTLNKEDYQTVKEMLSKKYKTNKPKTLKDTLTIKTTKNIYYFKINENYICYKEKCTKNKEIQPYLKTLEKKYQNKNFYTITYTKQTNNNKNNININLDKTTNYIIIKTKEEIKNFKINEIEYQKGTYKDIDLLYQNKNIKEKTITIRKSITNTNQIIRISFTNKYNYNISIIPIYKNNQIKFETKYKAKNSKRV